MVDILLAHSYFLKYDAKQLQKMRPYAPLATLYGGAPLLRINYETLAQFKTKQEAYTKFEAREMHAQGVHARMRSYVSMPLREFYRRYLKLEGYRDGWHGLQLSALMAYYAFRRQVYLRRLWQTSP
jgi:hypothetical protein